MEAKSKESKESKQERNYVTSHIRNELLVTPNQGSNNIILDLERTLNNMTIDGVTGKNIREIEAKPGGLLHPHGRFENVEQVKTFFKKYLVSKLPRDLQDEAIEYLLRTFHQGGYMNLASSPNSIVLSTRVSELTGKDGMQQPLLFTGREGSLTITTTPSGFRVREEYRIPKVMDYSQILKLPKAPNSHGVQIVPDKGKDCVYGVEAEVELDFVKKTNRLLSNRSFYGNEAFREFIQSPAEKQLDQLQKEYAQLSKEIKQIVEPSSVGRFKTTLGLTPDLSVLSKRQKEIAARIARLEENLGLVVSWKGYPFQISKERVPAVVKGKSLEAEAKKLQEEAPLPDSASDIVTKRGSVSGILAALTAPSDLQGVKPENKKEEEVKEGPKSPPVDLADSSASVQKPAASESAVFESINPNSRR